MTRKGTGCRVEYGTDLFVAGRKYMLWTNIDEKWDRTTRLITATHGHGGYADMWLPSHTFLGRHARALVSTGRYMVCSLDAGGPTAWSNQAGQDEITACKNTLQARGAYAPKYGQMGYSMGGGCVINHMKQDDANIAGTIAWAPCTDGNWVRSTGGYVPDGYAVPNNATWAAEFDAAHGSFAGSAGFRIMDEAATTYHNLTSKLRIIHATDDATVPYAMTTRFLALANNPNFSLRQPDIVGGHTGQFQNTPDQETVDFFDSLAW